MADPFLFNSVPVSLHPVDLPSLIQTASIDSPITLQDEGSTINVCGPDNCVPLPILIFIIGLLLMWSFEAFSKEKKGVGFFSLVWLMVLGTLLVLLV